MKMQRKYFTENEEEEQKFSEYIQVYRIEKKARMRMMRIVWKIVCNKYEIFPFFSFIFLHFDFLILIFFYFISLILFFFSFWWNKKFVTRTIFLTSAKRIDKKENLTKKKIRNQICGLWANHFVFFFLMGGLVGWLQKGKSIAPVLFF